MVGLGFFEVYNYSFAKNGDWELQNPPSQDKKFLRTNLADGLSANIKENSKYFKDIKIFELGKIFFCRRRTVGFRRDKQQSRFLRDERRGRRFARRRWA